MTTNTYERAVLLALTLSVAVAQAQPPALTIHMENAVSKVSPTLYGLMTEEINYSYDGGIYAEMVRNRTFRANWSGVLYWFLIEDGDAQARIEIDRTTGPSETLSQSLRLHVTRADAQNQAGILNQGYWGMALTPNATYHGSFYAKADSEMAGPIHVQMVSDAQHRTLASTSVSALTTSWKQFQFSLTTGAIQPSSSNHLVLTVEHAGTVWLNLVCLFPPTYHSTSNGNRIDLMEKLAAMHPAFMRFPGGNYLEGDHISDRFEWKKTLGPIVDRPTHPSPWHYQSSDGMGLLEFLQWCEDLNMQPVLAVYAGYSMQQEHVNPGPDLDPYVRDALDEIEYVTGGPESQWGAIRSKNGHPQPFKLNYVEIGNEDFFDRSRSYDRRYAQFYRQIKAKYPNLEIIATAPVKGVRPDVIDEHFYKRATEFFQDTTHYDKTDRNGPRIFVGEWATREGVPTPNFGAALGDAAWMTGLERNSDIVIMASYAPLFVNVNPGGMQWETDLIGYDALSSYGSPSYYAQVIFSTYLGDVTLESKLDRATPKLFYSVTKNTRKKQIYLKLVNAASIPQPIDIAFEGGTPAATGKLVLLKALDTQATNTIDHPLDITPVETRLENISVRLHYTAPQYSIQVLQIDER
jgi:alpha-N-arabinofuranosidase